MKEHSKAGRKVYKQLLRHGAAWLSENPLLHPFQMHHMTEKLGRVLMWRAQGSLETHSL
jgi:hypothetical protein